MRIKRTFAPSMREALQLVKREQGSDAVILGNNKVPGGVEILSAIDFDEDLVSRMASESSARDLRPASTPNKPGSDAASDAWIGTVLNDGRKEPTLGPVAAGSTTAVRSAAPMRLAPKPAPRPRPAVAKKPPVKKTSVAANRIQTRPKPPAKKVPAVNRTTKPAPLPAKPMIDEVKVELRNLRDLMESQLSVLQWDRFSQRHPVRTVLLNLMAEMGLGSDVCETIFSHLDQINSDPQKVWQQALGILARCLPINRRDLMAEGGRIALVGSTGVGKTTTIAKIAARFAQAHGKRSVAMISTDHFRIGAQEQLQHFARLLEIPLLTAGNSEQLCDRLEMLTDKKLVLIDTAGMSQRDLRLSEQFHRLQVGSPSIKPYLVLSANTQLAALNQTILNFGKVKLAGAIVTKLDEAASLGGIITAAIRHQLVLAYCGTGQKVPKDLEPAKSHRLVSRAVAMMQQYGEHAEQESLALRYNHIINQNQA